MMDVREQDRQYRRGMVLGLTMAEIMLLLIFLLLLILAVRFVEERRIADQRIVELNTANKRVSDLEERVRLLGGNDKVKIKITEEYIKVKAENEKLEREKAEAMPALKAVEEIVTNSESMSKEAAAAEAKRLAEIGKKIEAQAKAQADPGTDPKKAVEDYMAAAKAGDAVRKSGKSLSDIMAQQSCSVDLQSCIASNEKLSHKIAAKSGTLPSCWSDPITQDTQYLFMAHLKDDGIWLQDEQPSSEAAAKAKPDLPAHNLVVGRSYSASEFADAGRALLTWSDKQTPPCRLYVKVIDETGNDKNFYVRLKERGVEQVFYIRKVN
jgi:hypothetical protein